MNDFCRVPELPGKWPQTGYAKPGQQVLLVLAGAAAEGDDGGHLDPRLAGVLLYFCAVRKSRRQHQLGKWANGTARELIRMGEDEMAGTLTIQQRDNVLLTTLVNPPHGLMDRSMVAALGELAARANSDPTVGAVVLTGGHEERFIAHYDVGEILEGTKAAPTGLPPSVVRASLRATAAARHIPALERMLGRSQWAGLVAIEQFHKVMLSIQQCAAVWIAAINGHALGGGCELSLACDLRFMAEGEWRIGQPEIFLGFLPGGGGTQRLTRLLGPSRALRICLEGTPMTSARALEVGLIDRIIARDELLDVAIAEAARLGRRPKTAIGACKRAVYEGGSLPLMEGLRLEASELVNAVTTTEALTAMRAYVEALERTGELPAYDFDQVMAADQRGYLA